MKESFLQSVSASEILKFRCPRYEELPAIDLYMDQVLSIIEEVMSVFSMGEKVLTASMVNNYVKQRIVSPPVNKKYSRKHMAYLLVVCILKKVFSISEICRMVTIQTENYPMSEAYDFFCEEVEKALRTAFTGEVFVQEDGEREEEALLRSAVLSFAQKVRTQKYLEYRLVQDHAEEVEKRA